MNLCLTMEFYYNSGLPQRQRRPGRESRQNVLNKDVPSFLVYPDGSHSLGVISPASARPEEESANQDSTVSGPFVVWADPSTATPNIAQNQDGDQTNYIRHAFFAVLVLDLTFCSMILADTISNVKSRTQVRDNFSMPPLELTAAVFAIGTVAKLTGAWGVYYQRIRQLTVFAALGLLLIIVHLVWVGSLTQLLILALDLLLVLLALQVRGQRMGAWFAASR